MRTVEELREFYKTTLRKDLAGLEQKRRQTAQKVSVLILVVALVVGVCLVFWLTGGASNMPFMFIPIILCVLIGGGLYKLFTKGYVLEFKSLVIGKIVHFIDENLDYAPSRCIPKSIFVSSKIFTTKPNRYKGDDLVTGKVGSTAIKFSELHAEYESGSGKNRHRHTVFKGLFFVGDFNKHFRGETVVLPDTAEKLFGRLGQKLQSLNVFRGQLIKLEDPEFERDFAVYGRDQIEARYILSPSLMERILEFKRKTGKKIHMSFVGSMVFVAISYMKDLFEPKIFSTLLDFGPIREYFEDLQLAIGIVDDLNLNTRIWSKG
jgi:flagellar biosynthesis protein FliQ